jgi:hypothetical protein
MDPADIRDSLDEVACLGVDDDHLTVAQVRDKQQLSIRIDARVIKAGCTPTERNVGKSFETQRWGRR